MARTDSIAPSARYEALFAAALTQLPGVGHPWIRRLREARFQQFRELGFPGPKAEAWKYTSLRRFIEEALEVARPAPVARDEVAPHLIDEPDAIRLVFVNGRFRADLSDDLSAENAIQIDSLAGALDAGSLTIADLEADDPVARGLSALNGAFVGDGCILRLADRAAPRGPVQLLFLTAGANGPVMINPRNLIVLGDGARLHLIESHVAAGSTAGFTNLVNRVLVGRGAELRHERLEITRGNSGLIGRTEYNVSADARLTQCVASFGGALVRNEIDAVLVGRGGDVALSGLYLGRGRDHVDNQIRVEHAQPGSRSDQFYKGVLDDHARAVFAGQIVVQRAAQKTNAYQSNKNLLLSPDAEIDTKPELEIFADDVKCSHGATAGELDEHELFYLRSRGLDPATASSLLTFAFADEVLERSASTALAARAKRELLRWLPDGDSLKELL